jgi:hypothetical protein
MGRKKKEPVCEHENCEYTTEIKDFRKIKTEGMLYVVMVGRSILHKTCLDCGEEMDEIVCGGVLFNPELA